jgi:hypothetical protein
MPALPQPVVAACSVWANDNTAVNEDATVANVAIGVGLAALVGTAVYGLIYGIHESHRHPRVALTPMLAPSTGGLSLSSQF